MADDIRLYSMYESMETVESHGVFFSKIGRPLAAVVIHF